MGHGHVVPNKDGSRARCGGPTICSVCALELQRPRKKVHIDSDKCWCQPELIGNYESEGGTKHYLHKEEQ